MAKAAKKDAPETKGRGWLIWLRVFVWTCLCAGLAWGGIEMRSFMRSDARFTLACEPSDAVCRSLEIHGAKYVNPARLRAIFRKDYGSSIFSIPLDERRRSLLGVDWVEAASISRVWPDRIVVTITERKPVAFARLPIAGSTRNFLSLVDSQGVLLAMPQRVRFQLPVLTGLSEQQTDAERQMRVKAMQHLLADLGPRAQDVSEINAASVQEMRVIAAVEGHGVELWLGDQHYLSRFNNFLKHYPDIRKHSEDAAIFDLRLDDRILAKQP